MSVKSEQTTEQYHAETSTISKTQLNLFCTSPVEFYRTFITGEMQKQVTTKPMQFGTVMHTVLLEKKPLDEVVSVYSPECFKKNGAVNPVPASKYRAEIFPKLACKQREWDDYQRCADALGYSLLSIAIEASTECEKRHDGRVAGMDCRCKPDMLCDMGDHILIYDLKFCDPHPAAFNRSAKRFRYWLQDAHYSAVLTAETGKPTKFRFFAVEPSYPFRVQCYWYTPRQREIARDYHAAKLKELAHCYEHNVWEDNWPNELELNPWDVNSPNEEEPELEGFDE